MTRGYLTPPNILLNRYALSGISPLFHVSVEAVTAQYHRYRQASTRLLKMNAQGPEAAANKEAMLLALCAKAFAGGRTIVFFRTKARRELTLPFSDTVCVPHVIVGLAWLAAAPKQV